MPHRRTVRRNSAIREQPRPGVSKLGSPYFTHSTQLFFIPPKKRDLGGRGTARYAAAGCRLLVREKELRKSCRVDGAEHRRPRRQQRRIQEVGIELVAAGWRAVVVATGIEQPSRLAAIKQADDGALIEQGSIPSFEKAQEVVDTAVRAEVLAAVDTGGIPRGDLERNLLAGDNARSDVGRCPRAREDGIEWGGEGIDVIPADRENRNRIGGDGGGNVGIKEFAARRVRVEVSLDVSRVFRRDGQTARDTARARGQTDEAAIHKFHCPTEKSIGILAAFI